MKLNIKVLKGGQLSLEVESDSVSVLEVKSLVAEKNGTPVEKQSLVFKGKPLADSQNLRFYRIPDGAKLFLAVKSGGTKATTAPKAAVATPSSAPPPPPSSTAPEPMETQSGGGETDEWKGQAPFRTKPFTARERARNEISTYLILLSQVLKDYFSPEDLIRVVDFFMEDMVDTLYSINLDGVEYMATECLRMKGQGVRKEVVGLAAM